MVTEKKHCLIRKYVYLNCRETIDVNHCFPELQYNNAEEYKMNFFQLNYKKMHFIYFFAIRIIEKEVCSIITDTNVID